MIVDVDQDDVRPRRPLPLVVAAAGRAAGQRQQRQQRKRYGMITPQLVKVKLVSTRKSEFSVWRSA